MSPQKTSVIQSSHKADLISLLSCHYGDGTVYLPEGKPKSLIKDAVRSGLISEEGYLTRKGRTLIASFQL